ncbi:MAG TPA: hypothetical protein VFH70_01520 [Acidimicrobiales bacterium]|nr:hypothetical protein [Acidimicrobiales bacterium]
MPRDRDLVEDAVRQGGDVGEDHLARVVIDYAAIVIREQESAERLGWLAWLFAGLTAAASAGVGLAGNLRLCIVLAVTSMLWLAGQRRGRISRARVVQNARNAEQAASRRVTRP